MTCVYDAVVLGAGVAGSAAAKALADCGWSTALLDRHRFPRHKVCGEFLSPESQGTLARLGLEEAVKELSPSRITRTELYMHRGGAIAIPLPGAAYGISRYLLDAILLRAAETAGVLVRQGMTALSVQRRGELYEITARTGHGNGTEKLLARSVIGAWGGAGLKGIVREGLSHAAESYVGVKMHYRARSDGRSGQSGSEAVELYFFEGGYLGLNAVEDGNLNAAALLRRDDIPASHRSVAAMLEEAAARHPRLRERMADLTALPETASAVSPVRISLRPVPWADMPLIGDAVCRIPPLCGDGMSMALRSAELCVTFADRYLRGGLTLPQWERAYSAALMREFRRPLRWGRLAQALLGSPLLSHALPGLARAAPWAAAGMVRATRLSARVLKSHPELKGQ
ncbi:NAD(P)/FAD-dependent oxidoreductase [Paenibacillus nanensis]|uniref:NAD(P)/FAD-dependent oxidoreductase n=1 Tax=Paenibacillus nanensis TaxID=393251 RepID=A0A3A1UMF8_9BACL|nr:FAD-dependent monooxygenase [Paenibacillus nanensis]RIX48580.1 NAD(P)/FAD-dependent oxidoreductase [Paenibacillus nanensis]